LDCYSHHFGVLKAVLGRREMVVTYIDRFSKAGEHDMRNAARQEAAFLAQVSSSDCEKSDTSSEMLLLLRLCCGRKKELEVDMQISPTTKVVRDEKSIKYPYSSIPFLSFAKNHQQYQQQQQQQQPLLQHQHIVTLRAPLDVYDRREQWHVV
jgi:hypothetical protein